MRIFIAAVSGTAMGSLAGLLTQLGHDVAGCDTAFYPPMGPALKQWGVRCFEGFDAQLIQGISHQDPVSGAGLPPEVVIIGNVCRKDNPIALAAQAQGIPRMHLADALAQFVLPNTAPLVVAGTHGKTTTSSLCAHLLLQTGFEPGFLIGGVPQSLGRGFRPAGQLPRQGAPRAVPYVLEGDEYDTAFWEKTAKFLHYRAEVAVITAIEHDHIDIYPTASSYVAAFERFVDQLPQHGLLVAYSGDAQVVEVAKRAACPVIYYGLEDTAQDAASDYVARVTKIDPLGSHFELVRCSDQTVIASFLCPMSGEHNVLNATAALLVCALGYGASFEELTEPLAQFAGVKRRQELIGSPRGIRIFDDFAHHPTAVRLTLEGLRARYPQGRMIAVFEPRSATACRRLHQYEYESAFGAATDVVFAPIGRPDLPEDEKLDVAMLVSQINTQAGGPRASYLESVDSIVNYLTQLAEPGDSIAVLSNGAFGGIHAKLIEALK